MVTRRLVVRLSANATRFRQGMAASGSAVEAFQARARKAMLAVSAAFVAAAGAAAKMAADFEAEMTRVITLVGVARERVRGWSGDVRQVARDTGQSSQELAKGLFAITSGGERGSEAMDVLRASAQAAALGLGDVEQIGRTATAALQAFGHTGLTAKDAVAQMTAAVREGNLRAEDLSGSLGKVMGIAAQVGVSFAETNAFIAAFTRLGVDARVASTSLRAALARGVIKPTNQARKAFEEIGLPIERFREMVEEDLAGAFIELIRRSQGNLDVIGKLIPNVRALAGVLGTAGVQADQFREIQDNIADSGQILSEGMEELEETTSFAFRKMRQEFATTAQEFGDKMLPLAEDLAAALSTVASALGLIVDALELIPAPVRRVVISMAALGATIGGTISVGMKFVGWLKSAAAAIPGVTGVAGALGTAFASVSTAATGLFAAVGGGALFGVLKALQQVLRDVSGEAEDTRRSFEELRGEIDEMSQESLEEWRVQVANALFRAKEMKRMVGDMQREFGLQATITKEMAEELGDSSLAGRDLNEVMRSLSTRVDNLRTLFQDQTTAINEAGNAAENAVPSYKAVQNAIGQIDVAAPDIEAPDLSEFQPGELEAPFDTQAVERARQAIADLSRQTRSDSQRIFTDLLRMRDAFENLDQLPNVTQRAAEQLVVRLGAMAGSVEQAMTLIRDALGEVLTEEQLAAIREQLQGMEGVVDKEGQSIAETAKSMAITAGQSIIQGIILGSNNLRDQLKRFFANLASQAIMGEIASALGWGSPAKELIPVGEGIAQGLMAGMDGMRGQVEGAAQRLSTAAKPAAPGMGGGGAARRRASAALAAGGGFGGAPGGRGGGGGGEDSGPATIQFMGPLAEINAQSVRDAREELPRARREMQEQLKRMIRDDPQLRRLFGA